MSLPALAGELMRSRAQQRDAVAVLDMLSSATKELFVSKFKEFGRPAGELRAISQRLLLSGQRLSSQGKLEASASAIGLAHIISQVPPEGDCTESVARFADAKGNMLKFYERDVLSFGAFLAQCPAVAAVIPAWSHKLQQEAAAQKEVEVERNRLIDGIREAFAKADDSIDVSLFWKADGQAMEA